MDSQTQQQLLALNRAFYERVAEPFDVTRLASSVGKAELVRRLPLESKEPPLTLADIGCGNGRLAWLLDERAAILDYIGVDANAQLLALAQAHTADLCFVRTRFIQADLAQADWPVLLLASAHDFDPGTKFDIITCLATLHHLPGYELRRATLERLASLVKPGGILAVSAWQFLTTARFSAKVVDWAEVGIDPAHVEPGDALLPWNQGVHALRYLHQIDLEEMTALATSVGFAIETHYFADGKEGNLNLYAILRRSEF